MKADHHSCIAVCFALLVACSQTATADDIGILLDKVAAAYGGLERLAAVTAYQQYGETTSAMHRLPGQIHRAFQYPDQLRIEISYDEDDSELRVMSGAVVWKQGQRVTGALYSAMLLQAARLGLPNTLLDHRDKLLDTGVMAGRQGNSLRTLELPFHGNLRLVVGIDPGTGRILESRGIMDPAQGHGTGFAATYDDFRMVEGRLFAFSETHYAMGSLMGHTTLERIEVTRQLPEHLFDGSKPGQPGPDQHMALQ